MTRSTNRITRTLVFILLIAITSSLLFGCGGKKTADTGVDTDTPATELATPDLGTPAADLSERAMENFLDKVGEGNYVINCEANLFSASVVSEDLVCYTRDINFESVAYDGCAVMTVNGSETFFALLGEDGLTMLTFIEEGKAIDIASTTESLGMIESALPNHWIKAAYGNIWELFYNDVEEPLTFVSSSDEIKSFVKLYAGIGETGMSRMKDVFLTLDAEDPTEAHIKTSFTEGYPKLNDVDIVITFGGAEADPRAEAWMNDADREYPGAKTEWGANVIDLNAVFLPEYGEVAVPFPDFATYAFRLDVAAILDYDEIRIRDCRATEEGMNEYIEKLLGLGFKAVEADGETYYRLMLRDEYKCSSSIRLEYDNGVNLVARKYYEFPTYEGLDEINGQIETSGYPVLPENEHLSGFSALDYAYELTESWLYFFNYDPVLYVDFTFDDREEAEDFMDAYVETLEKEGFVEDTSGDRDEYDEDYDEVKAYLGDSSDAPSGLELISDEDVYYRLRTSTEMKSFKYRFNGGDSVTLLFKVEKFVPAEEVRSMTVDAGFPEIDLEGYESCRNFVKFQKTMYGREYPLDLSLSLGFETAADAEDLLDEYIGVLRDDNSFDIANPNTLSMNAPIVYAKEADGKLLAFGVDYVDGSTTVNVEFRVFESWED